MLDSLQTHRVGGCLHAARVVSEESRICSDDSIFILLFLVFCFLYEYFGNFHISQLFYHNCLFSVSNEGGKSPDKKTKEKAETGEKDKVTEEPKNGTDGINTKQSDDNLWCCTTTMADGRRFYEDYTGEIVHLMPFKFYTVTDPCTLEVALSSQKKTKIASIKSYFHESIDSFKVLHSL